MTFAVGVEEKRNKVLENIQMCENKLKIKISTKEKKNVYI